MRIDPIQDFTSRAAASARQHLLEHYLRLAEEALAKANYLKQLGQGIKTAEAESARNREFFERYEQKSVRLRS